VSGDGPRKISPTGNPPSVGRTPTPDSLAHEIRRLRETIAGRLERVEEFADGEILDFIKKAGAQYDTVTTELARLGAKFEDATVAVTAWRADIRREFSEHNGRIFDLEDRGSRHHVRLDTIDENISDLQSRVRPLEQHQAGDARELSLTRTQQRRLDARAGLISTIAGGLAALLSHLL
jgi:chromosome segregation ATPase